MNITLYRYQFVDNGMGLWKNAWFLVEADAELSRTNLIGPGTGYFEPKDGPCGRDGEVTGVEGIDVDLTPEGILAFAQDRAFAADE